MSLLDDIIRAIVTAIVVNALQNPNTESKKLFNIIYKKDKVIKWLIKNGYLKHE
jgi:hypothetical protein